MQSLRIGIVGAGTAGLAAAAFLTDQGQDVTLFERFDSPKPLGSGLLLQPTGLAVLAKLGLAQEIAAQGSAISHLDCRTVAGRMIFDVAYGTLSPGLTGLGIHRGALFGSLYRAVTHRSVRIETGQVIEAAPVEHRGRALVDADGNHRGCFDLIVDAGGYRSTLRDAYGDVRLQRAYPYGAIWGVVSDDAGDFDPECLQQRYDAASVMIGLLPIGHAPERKGRHLAFFWSLPAASYPDWRDAGLEDWKDRVLGYWRELGPLISQIRDVDDLTFASYGDVVLQRLYADRLVFIGDSAHAMSPQLGQGANLALIDAMVLSEVLHECGSIPEALQLFETRRRPHLRFYQTASRWMTPFFQSDNRPAAWIRDWSFGPLCNAPYFNKEAVRTLAGMKTGLFGSMMF